MYSRCGNIVVPMLSGLIFPGFIENHKVNKLEWHSFRAQNTHLKSVNCSSNMQHTMYTESYLIPENIATHYKSMFQWMKMNARFPRYYICIQGGDHAIKSVEGPCSSNPASARSSKQKPLYPSVRDILRVWSGTRYSSKKILGRMLEGYWREERTGFEYSNSGMII